MNRFFKGLKALGRLATLTGLVTAVCLTSCKKTAPDAGIEKNKQTRVAAADMRINLDEVYARLPQTIMHNLAGSFKMDASHAEWIYEEDYLLVRIPVNDAVNKSYIYAAKYFNNPMAKPLVYLSQFIPDAGSNGKDFTGKQMWLNLQDWTIYGVKFEHNRPVGYMQPESINPRWEAEMLNAGLFYLDANDKIAVYDEPKNTVMVRRTPNGKGGDKLMGHGDGQSFFEWLGGIFSGGLTGLDNWFDGSAPGTPGAGVGWTGGEPGSNPGDDPRYHGGGGGYHEGEGEVGGGYDSSEDPSSPDYNPPIDIWGHIDGSAWASTNGTLSGPVSGIGNLGNATVDYLVFTLDLNAQQAAWLLSHNDKAHRMKAYMLTAIPTLTSDIKKEIMREHLERMRTDPAYLDFVNNYDQNHTGMWWMNEDWVNDLSNFELTPNGFLGISSTWRTLTAQEKTLVKLYPVQAFIIFTRFGFAQDTAHATNLPGKTNGKQDAFCHAFFQAICVRDMVPRFNPVYISRAQIVLLFSTAHESETPPQRVLAKQMDLFNNSVGITYGESISIFTLDNTIENAISNKVTNGELRYLTPVEPDPPNGQNGPNNDFWHVNGNTQLGRHGILSSTQIVPTNQ